MGSAPPQYIIINIIVKITGTCKLQSLIVGHWPVTGLDYAPIVSLLLELNRGGVWGYKIKYFKIWHNLINFSVIVFARWRLCMSSMFLLLPIFGSNVIFAKLYI